MSLRLLLVDDDDITREVLLGGLQQLGYSADTAQDGQEAWEKIENNLGGYSLVLLDRDMPRLNGIALLKRIKSDKRMADLPIIMLTGSYRPENISEGLAAGAYYYLAKPASQEVLQRVIKNTLRDYYNERELLELLERKKVGLSFLKRAEFEIRTLVEAKNLSLLLADASMDPPRTINGYSELLINAVEHGNLGITYEEKGQLITEGRWQDEVESRLQRPPYDERLVQVVAEKIAGAFKVTITDQGDGFDWKNYISFNPTRMYDLHGRGIAMSNAMSFDHIEYLGNGNSVVTTAFSPEMRGK